MERIGLGGWRDRDFFYVISVGKLAFSEDGMGMGEMGRSIVSP